MVKEMQKFYYSWATPGVVLVIIFFILDFFEINFYLGESSHTISITLLLFAALFSVILPLWFKLMFVKRVKGLKNVDRRSFIKFEKVFVLISSFSIYVVVVAYIFQTPQWLMLIIALFSLYSLYFYFPSEKRIKMESKIFRVKD